MWRVYKEAGREWPVIDDDDVIDYMIMEAVALKASAEDQKVEKKKEVKNWKKDSEGLNKLRNL